MSKPRTADLMEKYKQAAAHSERLRQEEYARKIEKFARPLIDAYSAADQAQASLSQVMNEYGFVQSKRGMWRCIVCQQDARYPRQLASHRMRCAIPTSMKGQTA